jgi:hypothetical protein
MVMTQETMTLKYPYKDLFRSYLDFDHLKPYEPVKSCESIMRQTYCSIIETLSRSQEGIDVQGLIKKFVDKAIQFISTVIKTMIQLIYNVMAFFKKLIMTAMNESLMKSYSEFYESHKEAILENYQKYGSTCFVTAIPPKSITSFNSDNKIALSIQQTVNLLDELDRSFKQRVELWDEQNKRVNNRDSNNIFDQLRNRVDTIKTHITDSLLLAELGIRLQYDIKAISLYDPQVKDYVINVVNKSNDGSLTVKESLFTVFSIPKRILNIYLFGKEEVKPDVIPITVFLQMTGPKEFDKLSYNDMNRIKANALIIEGLVRKMDVISKKLQISGDKFCNSLKRNSSILIDLYSGGFEEAQSSVAVAQEWILPLLSISNSFYNYFSTIIINYSMYYYHHRKALMEASKALLMSSKLSE